MRLPTAGSATKPVRTRLRWRPRWVDQLTDANAPEEERQKRKRKRKLIYGLREFRDVRKDQHHHDAPAGKAKR